MTKTIATIRSELMDEFGLSESNSNAGTNSARVLTYLNEANGTFINSRTWTFNQAFYSLLALADTEVVTDFTTAAAAVVLGQTDGYGTTGKINVDNDIISFTGNDELTDTLTITTTEIDRNHLAGDKVSLLYVMPADYAKPTEVVINGISYAPDDIRNGFNVKNRKFWQHHFVSTAGVYRAWLQFPHTATTRTIYVKYSKLPVDFAAQVVDTYYINVPNPYFLDYLKYAVMSRMYRHLEEENMALAYEKKAEIELKRAAAYDSKQHAGTRVPMRTRWDNPRQVLYRTNHN